MREFKFRAWDGKKMIPFCFDDIYGYEGEVCGVLLPTGEMLNNNSGYGRKGDDDSGDDDKFGINPKLEIMQFTGLLDKNGKEIYEGDILTGGVQFGAGVDPKKHYHIVKWDVQQTWHGMVDGNLSKSVGFTFKYYYFTEHGCEVIGNIYQNPELLESELLNESK